MIILSHAIHLGLSIPVPSQLRVHLPISQSSVGIKFKNLHGAIAHPDFALLSRCTCSFIAMWMCEKG